jgi:anti-sigma B factor antagonist
MSIQVRHATEGRVTIVEPEGRIDSSSLEVLDEAFRQAFSARAVALLVDMGKVEYISSGGLRSLLLALKEMKKCEGSMALCCLSPSVSKVFKLSGFNTIFDIIPGREEAVVKLRAGSP